MLWQRGCFTFVYYFYCFEKVTSRKRKKREEHAKSIFLLLLLPPLLVYCFNNKFFFCVLRLCICCDTLKTIPAKAMRREAEKKWSLLRDSRVHQRRSMNGVDRARKSLCFWTQKIDENGFWMRKKIVTNENEFEQNLCIGFPVHFHRTMPNE